MSQCSICQRTDVPMVRQGEDPGVCLECARKVVQELDDAIEEHEAPARDAPGAIYAAVYEMLRLALWCWERADQREREAVYRLLRIVQARLEEAAAAGFEPPAEVQRSYARTRRKFDAAMAAVTVH